MKIPDILIEIVNNKREELENNRKLYQSVQREITDAPPVLNFKNAISNNKSIIAEVKKASPSAGLIAENFDPSGTAMQYEKGGADAISVLTDMKYFKGHNEYLKIIKETVKIPVLRKDFIISTDQIYEARALGADSFLLISAILEKNQLNDYLELGRSMGMEALVESHDEYELEKAIEANSLILGINNRNLRNFTVDLDTTKRLIPMIPKNKIIVGESGILANQDAELLFDSGCNALLIGEFLMKSKDKSRLINELKS